MTRRQLLSLAATAPLAAANPQPLALIELFTSEGCSSCPPADRLLIELATRPNLTVLGFHVDYWDRLGWRDRFSLASATQRQSAYAQRFSLNSIYTPQAVINGSREVIGNQRADLLDALSQPANSPIALTVSQIRIANATWHAQLDPQPTLANSELLVAFTLRSASTQVQRGENSGRLLQHANPVLAFHNLGKLDARPRPLQLPIPKLWTPEDGHVVLLAQRPGPGPVLAIASV